MARPGPVALRRYLAPSGVAVPWAVALTSLTAADNDIAYFEVLAGL